jgi:hypothetical protein
MHSTAHQPGASRADAAAAAAAAARGTASPLQVTAAASLWRALSDESAIWLLMPLPPRRGRPEDYMPWAG